MGQPSQPVVPGKKEDEVLPIAWISDIGRDLVGINWAEYDFVVNECTPGFGKFNNWLEGHDMKADGLILYKDTPNMGSSLPALWTETESNGDFYGSINKTARGVITQLRCLRCF